MLLSGSLASAQTTLGRPVLPAIHTTDFPELPVLQQTGATSPAPLTVQPAAFQPRVPANLPQAQADEGADFDFPQELPSYDRVLHLESEAQWQQRLIQHEKDKGRPPPIFPEYASLTKEKYYGRQWPQQGVHPEPNYVCYGRLFFEQKNFERYGWDLGFIAPVVETLAFGADVALLPYHAGTDPFRCYESSAGYCMPGDPTPLLLYPPEWSVTGAIAEAGTIAGLIAIFP